MEKQNHILGIVPGRRVAGFAILNDSGLQDFGVKSLRNRKTDSEKFIAVNRHLCKLVNSFHPRAIIILKPSPHKSTSFILQLITFIRGLAYSRSCPLYFIGMKQIKAVLGIEAPIMNHRQLAKALSVSYRELAHYLPKSESAFINDRERYYQPMFTAVGLAASYLKLLQNENKTNSDGKENT